MSHYVTHQGEDRYCFCSESTFIRLTRNPGAVSSYRHDTEQTGKGK